MTIISRLAPTPEERKNNEEQAALFKRSCIVNSGKCMGSSLADSFVNYIFNLVVQYLGLPVAKALLNKIVGERPNEHLVSIVIAYFEIPNQDVVKKFSFDLQIAKYHGLTALKTLTISCMLRVFYGLIVCCYHYYADLTVKIVQSGSAELTDEHRLIIDDFVLNHVNSLIEALAGMGLDILVKFLGGIAGGYLFGPAGISPAANIASWLLFAWNLKCGNSAMAAVHSFTVKIVSPIMKRKITGWIEDSLKAQNSHIHRE